MEQKKYIKELHLHRCGKQNNKFKRLEKRKQVLKYHSAVRMPAEREDKGVHSVGLVQDKISRNSWPLFP